MIDEQEYAIPDMYKFLDSQIAKTQSQFSRRLYRNKNILQKF